MSDSSDKRNNGVGGILIIIGFLVLTAQAVIYYSWAHLVIAFLFGIVVEFFVIGILSWTRKK